MFDTYLLSDLEGNIIAKREIIHHLRLILNERGIKPNEKFIVRSWVTGFEFFVTNTTTAGEWRDFDNKCKYALD